MTDYNDGKWHGWNGGDCPVHPQSTVDVQLYRESRNDAERGAGWRRVAASGWTWKHSGRDGDIIAFRVINPYDGPTKPIEFWIAISATGKALEGSEDRHDLCEYKDVRLFREVLP